MYHVRSRNQHLPSVIRNSELIVKILGKSDNNPDHLDIGVSRDIGDEGKRDVARIFSSMGQCDEFDQHVIVGVFQRFRLEKSDGRLMPTLGCIQTAQEPRCVEQYVRSRRPENWNTREQDQRRFAHYSPNDDHRYSAPPKAAWFKAGYSSGVAGVDARRAAPPDP